MGSMSGKLTGAHPREIATTRNFGLLRLLGFFAFALVAVPIEAARAAEFCESMKIVAREAQSNFSDWAGKSEEAMLPVTLPRSETCAMARALSGAKVYHCAWAFEYRAVGAYSAFDSLDRSLMECFEDRAQLSGGQSVNHPDSYDLRQYQVGQAKVTLSIKDKSALQSTYVFVRVHGLRPD